MNLNPGLRVLLLSLGLSAGACSDAVEPKTMAIAVQASPLETMIEYTEEGVYVLCDLRLNASAVGSDGMRASWETGVIEILGGTMRNISAGYINLAAENVREIWTQPDIAAGEDMEARLVLAHTEPFSGKGVFRYKAEGSAAQDTARFDFRCDAEDFVAGGPLWLRPPEIVSGPTVDLGSSISIRYNAGGSVGVVLTEIHVASDFANVVRTIDEKDRYDGTPAKYVHRTVQIPITGQHPLGSTIRVRAVATSATGEQLLSEWVEGPTVVDQTGPPAFSECLDGGIPEGCPFISTEITYTAADTLRAKVRGSDNYELKYLVWRVGEVFADSIMLDPAQSGVYDIEIPAQSSWSGENRLTVYFRDAAGNAGWPVQYPIRMIGRVEPPMRTLELPGWASRGVVDQAGTTLYLIFGDGSARAISLDRMSEEWRIDLPGIPMDLDLSPDQSTLAVILDETSSVAFLDITGGRPVSALADTGEDFEPRALSYLPDGSLLVTGSSTTLTRFSADGEVLSRPSVPHQVLPPLRLFRTPDYSRIVLHDGPCGYLFDPASNQTGSCRNLGSMRLSASLDGTRVMAGARLLNGDLGELRGTAVAGLSNQDRMTVISGDGRTAFWAHKKGFLGIDAETGRVEYLVPVSLSTTREGMLLNAAGGRLISILREDADGQSTGITVLDLD